MEFLDAYNEWRSHTFWYTLNATGNVQETVHQATENGMQELSTEMSGSLSTIAGLELDENRIACLSKVIDNAVALGRTLSLQRARYVFVMPEPSGNLDLPFDEELMEDVFGDEDSNDRLVRCVAFPALLKYGDELGDDMHLNNVIVKAKVFCYTVEGCKMSDVSAS
ncbi:hypothetical protein AAFC00_006112 [Neodothiora populina]|uniref:Uncharacterized protein n=1 Tax=Neodothiora populina TaxID=2781224 RepID=A0ABR3P4I3_9PEZI